MKNVQHLSEEKEEKTTLRDYFALQALSGLLVGYGDTTFNTDAKCNMVATEAYAIADAMLRIREKI